MDPNDLSLSANAGVSVSASMDASASASAAPTRPRPRPLASISVDAGNAEQAYLPVATQLKAALAKSREIKSRREAEATNVSARDVLKLAQGINNADGGSSTNSSVVGAAGPGGTPLRPIRSIRLAPLYPRAAAAAAAVQSDDFSDVASPTTPSSRLNLSGPSAAVPNSSLASPNPLLRKASTNRLSLEHVLKTSESRNNVKEKTAVSPPAAVETTDSDVNIVLSRPPPVRSRLSPRAAGLNADENASVDSRSGKGSWSVSGIIANVKAGTSSKGGGAFFAGDGPLDSNAGYTVSPSSSDITASASDIANARARISMKRSGSATSTPTKEAFVTPGPVNEDSSRTAEGVSASPEAGLRPPKMRLRNILKQSDDASVTSEAGVTVVSGQSQASAAAPRRRPPQPPTPKERQTDQFEGSPSG
jgi:hypothetical protein